MRLLLHCLLVAALFAPFAAAAQPANDDCSGAIDLCAQQPVTSQNNTGANVWPGFCPQTANVLWYTFTTNSVGGPVNVHVNNIQCPGTPNMGTALSVVVLSGNGSCLPNSFSTASPCEEDTDDFVLTTGALLPNTQYWVIVAGALNNGATIAAQCGFDISTDGPGANIVGVDFYAGPDVTLPQGSNTQLSATVVGGGQHDFLWSPTSGLSSNTVPNPYAQPLETTTYTVSTQINGCTYTDDQVVEIKRLIDPPNTITPNGDGFNDTWLIAGLNDYPQAEVSIYDRWGQRVFHSVGYKTPFDGGGLPTATYYWVIQISKLQGQSDPYTGYLTIVN